MTVSLPDGMQSAAVRRFYSGGLDLPRTVYRNKWPRESAFQVCLVWVLLAVSSAVAADDSIAVRIIAFNDFHGNLEMPEALRQIAQQAPVAAGGIDALAAHIGYLKYQNRNSIVVSAGDLIGASPLLSAWFHDEPTIELANRLQLDFNAVGNHEFDEGPDELLRMQHGGCHPRDISRSCQGARVGTPVPFEGAQFRMLAANVSGEDGQLILPAYAIKLVDGVRIGFIGLTLRETGSLIGRSAARGLTFADEAATINALVPELRSRGVAAIVVLIHQGGEQLQTPFDINGCAGELKGTPVQRIVAQLDDAVDIVVSGHTHAAYICRLSNAGGRRIPVTSAGSYGRLLTVIDFNIERTSRHMVRAKARNIVVERDSSAMLRNPAVDTLLANYRALIEPLKNRIVGSINSNISIRKNAACEMDAGNLAADAQLLAAQRVPFGGAQFALVNPGGIRAPGLLRSEQKRGGAVTLGDIFAMQPFGNTLVVLTLTGQQIRTLLEQQFAGCNGQTVNRMLQPSAGFRFRWSAARPSCEKISDITLHGIPIDINASYRLVVNDFLAAGGDGFTVLQHGTNLLYGGEELDALIAYFATYDLLQGGLPYDPLVLALAKPRIERLDSTAWSCP